MRHLRPVAVEPTRLVEWGNCESESPAGSETKSCCTSSFFRSDSWSLPRDAAVLETDAEFQADPGCHTFDAIDLTDRADQGGVSVAAGAAAGAQNGRLPKRVMGKLSKAHAWSLSRLGSMIDMGSNSSTSNSFRRAASEGVADLELGVSEVGGLKAANTANASSPAVRKAAPSRSKSKKSFAFIAARKLHRAAWLRPAILGASEGMVTTATVLMGVAAVVPAAPLGLMLICGLGALVTGAFSLAIGEYTSVSSQRDLHRALLKDGSYPFDYGDLEDSSTPSPGDELTLTGWYMNKGLTTSIAKRVAKELSQIEGAAVLAHEQLGLHANPWGAAWTSAFAFCIGALVPFLSAVFIRNWACRLIVLFTTCLLAFASLGAFGAFLSGSPMLKSSVRLTVGGLVTIGLTYGLLKLLTASYTVTFVHYS